MEPGDRSPPPGRPEDPHLARAAGRGDDSATLRQGARGATTCTGVRCAKGSRDTPPPLDLGSTATGATPVSTTGSLVVRLQTRAGGLDLQATRSIRRAVWQHDRRPAPRRPVPRSPDAAARTDRQRRLACSETPGNQSRARRLPAVLRSARSDGTVGTGPDPFCSGDRPHRPSVPRWRALRRFELARRSPDLLRASDAKSQRRSPPLPAPTRSDEWWCNDRTHAPAYGGTPTSSCPHSGSW